MENKNKIENYDALIRRTTKMVKEFDLYPAMPRGNLSMEFIEDVFKYNPLFVLSNLKKSVMDMLLEQTDYKYDEKELIPIFNEVYRKYEVFHKERILNTLMKEFQNYIENNSFKYYNYIRIKEDETLVFYYAYSIFYISRILKNEQGLLVASKTLNILDLFYCDNLNTMTFRNGNILYLTGRFLNLSFFAEDKVLYNKLMQMIEKEITDTASEEIKQEFEKEKQKVSSNQKCGCYIATCVYGSYDCPAVCTLRRYRDSKLLKTWIGKQTVKFYYAVSPGLVKLFGNTAWFKKVWKFILDRIVKHLHSKGIESTPYQDINHKDV